MPPHLGRLHEGIERAGQGTLVVDQGRPAGADDAVPHHLSAWAQLVTAKVGKTGHAPTLAPVPESPVPESPVQGRSPGFRAAARVQIRDGRSRSASSMPALSTMSAASTTSDTVPTQ